MVTLATAATLLKFTKCLLVMNYAIVMMVLITAFKTPLKSKAVHREVNCQAKWKRKKR